MSFPDIAGGRFSLSVVAIIRNGETGIIFARARFLLLMIFGLCSVVGLSFLSLRVTDDDDVQYKINFSGSITIARLSMTRAA